METAGSEILMVKITNSTNEIEEVEADSDANVRANGEMGSENEIQEVETDRNEQIHESETQIMAGFGEVINVPSLAEPMLPAYSDGENQNNLGALIMEKLASIEDSPVAHSDADQCFTISRVPAHLRERNRMLYEPVMVSIGPHYRGRENLQIMEERKWRFLNYLTKFYKINIADCLRLMTELELRARRCYNQSIDLASDDFVLMLLLDGFFIIGFFLRYKYRSQFEFSEFGWGWDNVYLDFFLVENQIPFFVIHKLFSIIFPDHSSDQENTCRTGCVTPFLLSFLPESSLKLSPLQPPYACSKIQHLLHLYYMNVVPEKVDNPNQNHVIDIAPLQKSCCHEIQWMCRFCCCINEDPAKNNELSEVEHNRTKGGRSSAIHCASELHEAGVTFKMKKKPTDMFDITFKKGIMKMPYLEIDPSLRLLFTNLFAFEQSRSKLYGIFTSYAVLMDFLINTKKDVALLERCGIINNMLQSEEEVAIFFNHLSDYGAINYEQHHFRGLFLKLQKYSNSAWHRSRARLKHDYFNNPWTAISVFAAGMLLILTLLQTGFTIYSSLNHPK